MSKPLLLITGAAGRVGTLLRPILRDQYRLRLCDLFPIDDLTDDEVRHATDILEKKKAAK